MEIKLRPLKFPQHNHALSWKNNQILYWIKILKPKNFKKGDFKLNIYSVIQYNFFTFTSGNVQKVPDLGDITNVKNYIPDSIRNTNNEPNNTKFFLLMHKNFFYI